MPNVGEVKDLDATGVKPASKAIQTALDTEGLAVLPPGTFKLDATLVLDKHKELRMSRNTILRPSAADLTALRLGQTAVTVTGGEISYMGMAMHSAAAVEVRDTSSAGGWAPLRVRDLTIRGREKIANGSRALHFRVMEGEIQLTACLFDGLVIHGFDYAIDMDVRAAQSGIACINGLTFSNFFVSKSNHVLRQTLESGGEHRTAADGNLFSNFMIQSGADYPVQLELHGAHNYLTNWMIWDWHGETLARLGERSRDNWLLGRFEAGPIEDRGTGNTILSPGESRASVFSNLPFKTIEADYTIMPQDLGKVLHIREKPHEKVHKPLTISLSPDVSPSGGVLWIRNPSPVSAVLKYTEPHDPSYLWFLGGDQVVQDDAITIGPGGWLMLHKVGTKIWEAVGAPHKGASDAGALEGSDPIISPRIG